MVTNGLKQLARLGAVVAVVACTTQCQCLVPVDEGDDAGARDAAVGDGGAGRDGGVDGGRDAGVECVRPADCRGRSWVTSWCLSGGGDAGFSCVNSRCVATCSEVSNDTCTVDAGGECLSCGRDGTRCVVDSCMNDAFTLRVSGVECRPGVVAPLADEAQLTFASVRSASCLMAVTGPDGGLGFVTRAPQGGPFSSQFFSWNLPPLGGWCVSHQLQTGALRSSVACPLCTFVIEGL
jgi:hypothetical protein